MKTPMVGQFNDCPTIGVLCGIRVQSTAEFLTVAVTWGDIAWGVAMVLVVLCLDMLLFLPLLWLIDGLDS